MAFAALAVSGCDDPKPIYHDAAACAVEHDASQCKDAFTAAQAAWTAQPGYSSQADCALGQGDACVTRPDGRWQSPMVGFVLETSAPVEYGRDRRCADGAADDRSCHDSASGGHAFYAGTTFLRPASSSGDGVVTEASARAGTSGAGDGEHAVDRGGFGEAAEGHASGGHGGGGE